MSHAIELTELAQDARYYRIADYASADEAEADGFDEHDIEVMRRHEATLTKVEELKAILARCARLSRDREEVLTPLRERVEESGKYTKLDEISADFGEDAIALILELADWA